MSIFYKNLFQNEKYFYLQEYTLNFLTRYGY